MKITLKMLQRDELSDFWDLAFSNPNAEWTKWNGPYFHDKLPKKADFISSDKNNYLNNPFRKVIWVDDQMVGMVFAYYEDTPLNKWLDIGISIYQHTKWRQGIGKLALTQWITELFNEVQLPHIGLTTWSGNYRMLALSESLGLKKEAEVRKVRYWQGKYWDSVKYGVLKSEWIQLINS
ncbi:GNAT family N-acetyltransferase [Liquorilactobacillus mali]|nr:GNAT family protein [Liquorilactobacillus mali]MDC7954181.1 GNAT family N-acetyltransferase [Liquorilactobacillus mali]QFQ75707.1 GNAT family N-acetyltransferase [Liquorilactobacillus mali]